jgi:outer membrane immunogenic protein
MKAIVTGLGALCVLAAASAPTFAADTYRAPDAGGYKDGPAYAGVNWSGFYIGVNGGYAFSESATNSSLRTTVGTSSPALNSLNPEGGFGGGQIGINFQTGRNLVLGIEADIQGSSIKDGATTIYPNSIGNYGPFTYSSSYNIDWFGTVRGRLGYAFDRTLLYATGGLAYGSVDYKGDFLFTNTGGAAKLSRNAVQTGYVVGGGIEHKLAPNWSVKAEYQFIDLGSQTVSHAISNEPGNSVTTSYDANLHTVRAGLNYHIGQTYEPLK